jgi:hypothetical protein
MRAIIKSLSLKAVPVALFATLVGSSFCAAQDTAKPAQPDQPSQQSSATAPSASRVPAPDGAPTLPKDLAINQTTSVRESRGASESVIGAASSEEKIENRLAVIRAGGYVVTDPNVGRYDRAASNGVKRVSPSMWELFRF